MRERSAEAPMMAMPRGWNRRSKLMWAFPVGRRPPQDCDCRHLELVALWCAIDIEGELNAGCVADASRHRLCRDGSDAVGWCERAKRRRRHAAVGNSRRLGLRRRRAAKPAELPP